MSICIKDQIQNMNLVIGCTVGCAYCYARNNVKRWHMIDDFTDPEFFPGKLRMMEKKRPQNFLLTGMSDLSGWKSEWRDEVFEKILSEKNIDAFNGAQGRILYVLWQEDGISIRSLSTKCGLAITSLTTMLERMENQGLISRVQSETDKRKTLLFLTEKAHALKGEYDSVSDEMGSIYYKGFSEEEITRFEECLDRIRKNLEEWQKS